MVGSGRVTLRDVAAELGVSAKTVSNAYRHPEQLSADLRRRVFTVAERLGFAGPDPVAAGLRGGRVGAIAVIFDNDLPYAFDDPQTSALLAGASTVAGAAGAGLLLVPGSADPARRAAAAGRAVTDGVIASSLADDDPLLQVVIARRLPLVVVDQPGPVRLAELGAPGAPWVGVDDRAAAAEAARHLLQLGHRRLGVVAFGRTRDAPAGFAEPVEQAAATYSVTRDRLAGFRAAAERYGLDWSAVPVWHGTDSTPAEGEAGAAAVLAREPRPTGLLCLSDRLAEGALDAARRLGLDVPGDLSVVGFDDARPLAADLGLTTVAQPSRSKGERAAEALLRRLDGGDAGGPHLLATRLVVRTSTRARRRGDRRA